MIYLFILSWQWINFDIYISLCEDRRAWFITCLDMKQWGSPLRGSPLLPPATPGCDCLWPLWGKEALATTPAACWKQELLKNNMCFSLNWKSLLWTWRKIKHHKWKPHDKEKPQIIIVTIVTIIINHIKKGSDQWCSQSCNENKNCSKRSRKN